MIQTAIRSIHIHIDRRINHRMIKRSVKHCFLIGSSFYFKMIQFIIPVCTGCFSQLFKALSGSFGAQILNSSLGADSRECYFHNQFRFLGCIEIEIGYNLTSRNLREVLGHMEATPEAIVKHLFFILIAIVSDRLRQRNSEVGIVGSRPSVCDAIACQ